MTVTRTRLLPASGWPSSVSFPLTDAALPPQPASAVIKQSQTQFQPNNSCLDLLFKPISVQLNASYPTRTPTKLHYHCECSWFGTPCCRPSPKRSEPIHRRRKSELRPDAGYGIPVAGPNRCRPKPFLSAGSSEN